MESETFPDFVQRFVEILKDPDYKPLLLEALREHINQTKAETRDLESQTLARLNRIRTLKRPTQTPT